MRVVRVVRVGRVFFGGGGVEGCANSVSCTHRNSISQDWPNSSQACRPMLMARSQSGRAFQLRFDFLTNWTSRSSFDYRGPGSCIFLLKAHSILDRNGSVARVVACIQF